MFSNNSVIKITVPGIYLGKFNYKNTSTRRFMTETRELLCEHD